MAFSKRVGAYAGLAAPIVAFACILTAVATYPPFSWTNNALSDLGVVAVVTGLVFNFGLIASGTLALIFAGFSLFSYLNKSIIGKLGSAVFGAAAVALICIGIFNENFRLVHYVVSVGFFFLAPIALFILAGCFYLNRKRGMAAFTVIVAVAAALPWILEFAFHYAPNVALPELASGLAVSTWAIALATEILRKALL